MLPVRAAQARPFDGRVGIEMLITAFRRGWRFMVLAGMLLIVAALFAVLGASGASAQTQTGTLSGASLPPGSPHAAVTCVPNYAIAQASVTAYPTGTALVAGSRC